MVVATTESRLESKRRQLDFSMRKLSPSDYMGGTWLWQTRLKQKYAEIARKRIAALPRKLTDF